MGGNSSSPAHNIPEDESCVCFIAKDISMSGKIQTAMNGRFGASKWLLGENKNVGEVSVLAMSTYYIYFAVIKDHDYEASVIADVRTTLDVIAAHAESNGVATVNVLSPCYVDIDTTTLQTECTAATNGLSVSFVIYNIT